MPDRVTSISGATLKQISGKRAVTGIVVRRNNQDQSIRVDGVFIYLLGNRPVTGFLEGALPTDAYGCLQVDENLQTAIPGVFAAGDVLCPEIKQAVVAAAEGCRAAMQSVRYLNHKVAIVNR
ncbi:MAG: NAD(P)/FAD-dependent oxidoreductase [Bacillota bacterium]